jgi:cytochrome c
MAQRRRRALGVAGVLLAALPACGVQVEHGVAGGDPRLGEVAISRYGCDFCHAIPGFGKPAIEGPPLLAIGAQRYIAGVLPNRQENLVRWILDPQSVSPGTAMPTLAISEAEARHVAAYLYARTGGGPLPAPQEPFPTPRSAP